FHCRLKTIKKKVAFRKSSAKRAAQAVETTRKKHKTLPIGLPFQNSVEDGGGATEHLHKGAQPTNQAQAVPAGDEVLGGLQRQKEREAKEVGDGQRHHEGSRRLVKLMPRRAALTLVATSAAAVASLGRPADDDGQVAGDAHQEGDQVRAENGQKGEVAAQQVPQVDHLQRVGSVEDRVQEGRATVLTGGGGGGSGDGSEGFTADQISPMLKGPSGGGGGGGGGGHAWAPRVCGRGHEVFALRSSPKAVTSSKIEWDALGKLIAWPQLPAPTANSGQHGQGKPL
ncbi:hypothetical protein TYRP_016995, partial [Tyrophagus putrescentiae]